MTLYVMETETNRVTILKYVGEGLKPYGDP